MHIQEGGTAGERMRQFRTELKKHSPAFFRSPDDLAAQVTVAVYQDESTKRVGSIGFFNDINNANAFASAIAMGPSKLPIIQQKILEAKDADAAEINVGSGNAWWSTRLQLVAALATDFTKIRQLVFTANDMPISYVGGTGPARVHFVGMYAPADVRQSLAATFPDVEIAYLRARKLPEDVGRDTVTEVTQVVVNFGRQMHELSQGKGEESIKVWVDEDKMKAWMVRHQHGGVVERTGQSATCCSIKS